jgi:hypothetical protein
MDVTDVYKIFKEIPSTTFQQARGLFLERQGKMRYVHTGRGSFYRRGDTLLAGGTIYIDPSHIADLSEQYGDRHATLCGVIIHEMGHFMYQLQDFGRWPGNHAPINVRADHCLMAEARATVWAYQVIKELRAKGTKAIVVAPGDPAKTFEALAKAESSKQNLFNVAKAIYAADTTYVLYCRGEISWTGHAIRQLPPVRIVGRRPRR